MFKCINVLLEFYDFCDSVFHTQKVIAWDLHRHTLVNQIYSAFEVVSYFWPKKCLYLR